MGNQLDRQIDKQAICCLFFSSFNYPKMLMLLIVILHALWCVFSPNITVPYVYLFSGLSVTLSACFFCEREGERRGERGSERGRESGRRKEREEERE